MPKHLNFFLLISSLALIPLSPLYAQRAPNPAETTSSPEQTTDDTTKACQLSSAQAPDDAIKNITDLYHADKYAEAQRLIAGLLVNYPDDQRLIKAKALIENMLSPTNATPANSQPGQPVSDAQLTGMDKVDYDALIVLGRQAQQTTDLDQQKAALKQFMDQSCPFLQKHPDQMLLWQLRAVSSISLNDPMAGYEAGTRLLAAGVTDSTDSNVRLLLAQLKNKGWLDKQSINKKLQYDRFLGTWSVSWSTNQHMMLLPLRLTYDEEFSRSDSSIEGYMLYSGKKQEKPNLKVTILDSGEMRWETMTTSGWQPVMSLEMENDSRTIKITSSRSMNKHTYTDRYILSKH